jgi:transposase, IS605 OrfB family, central region
VVARRDPGPSSLRLIRTASGKYFVSLVVETTPAPLPQTGEAIGIDFGVARLATLSNGERIANPKHGAKWQRRMAFYQKRLARCQKSSKRRMQVKRHIARIHEKIANSRSDTLHKLSSLLVTRFDTICVEDLNLRGMVKNHSLARAVSDASIGTAIRMIEEKAQRYGKTVVKIDRWYPSSKTCSACGYIAQKLPLSVRDWTCPECGTAHDRDANAAANILAVGTRFLRMEGRSDGRELRFANARPREVRTNKVQIMSDMACAVGISGIHSGEDVNQEFRACRADRDAESAPIIFRGSNLGRSLEPRMDACWPVACLG